MARAGQVRMRDVLCSSVDVLGIVILYDDGEVCPECIRSSGKHRAGALPEPVQLLPRIRRSDWAAAGWAGWPSFWPRGLRSGPVPSSRLACGSLSVADLVRAAVAGPRGGSLQLRPRRVRGRGSSPAAGARADAGVRGWVGAGAGLRKPGRHGEAGRPCPPDAE